MGQAWCKEKSTKAQDSKSPLDRVFLRCAHRIYPGLKEEGSVLGGATQRVTSSEIGYASSPPHAALTRGRSIDSVDRPFHPSDWVDVNLEVPVTPRTNSAMTNFSLDTSIYPPMNITSKKFSGSNLKDFAPIPPPRRKKKNRGRPLPPKPDEVTSLSSKDPKTSVQQPLRSSVQMLHNRSHEKEIFEHKINGTGKIISSTVVAASGSSRENSGRENEKTGDKKKSRPINSSTVSLPNYSELGVSNENLLDDDDGEIKIHKITAAESLPALITSGVLENLKKSENGKKATIAKRNDDETECPMDEVDFSFDKTKNQSAINPIPKLEGLTSTPVKSSFGDDSRSPTTIGGWFLHQDRALESDDISIINRSETNEPAKTIFFDCRKDSRSDIFFEAEEDELAAKIDDDHGEKERDEKLENSGIRTRTGLRRTLSNESEPFDSCEEKELPESDPTFVRSNAKVELLGRMISEESLPDEMFENETDFFKEKRPIHANGEDKWTSDKKVSMELRKNNDTTTPPPSPEPKIKPEILDNDHSILLKVLRDEADESNLSSMTPSLTELEAALSDMLEREDDVMKEETTTKINSNDFPSEKILEKPIEPKILTLDMNEDEKYSGVSVRLKNILEIPKNSTTTEKSMRQFEDDSTMIEIDLATGDKFKAEEKMQSDLAEVSIDKLHREMPAAGEPPEKPSRLHHSIHEESVKNTPTPPKRRNRYSGYSSTILGDEKSLDRIPTPDDPYPNDRLI